MLLKAIKTSATFVKIISIDIPKTLNMELPYVLLLLWYIKDPRSVHPWKQPGCLLTDEWIKETWYI